MKALLAIVVTLPLLAADLPTPTLVKLEGLVNPPSIRVTWEYPTDALPQVQAWSFMRTLYPTNTYDTMYTVGTNAVGQSQSANAVNTVLSWSDQTPVQDVIYNYAVIVSGLNQSHQSLRLPCYTSKWGGNSITNTILWTQPLQTIPLEISPFRVKQPKLVTPVGAIVQSSLMSPPPIETPWQTNAFGQNAVK